MYIYIYIHILYVYVHTYCMYINIICNYIYIHIYIMIQDVTKLCHSTAIYTSDGCLALKCDQEPLGSNSWLVCSCIDVTNGGVEPLNQNSWWCFSGQR